MRPLSGLRAYQARTLWSLLRGVTRYRGVTFTVMFPRQAGKNQVQAALVALLLRANARSGGSVVVCAPSYRPQALISVERLLGLLEAAAPLSPPGGQPHLGGNTISVGRASAIFLSASPEAHVAGHTASIALIADEAQEIEAAWFDRQFRPMAAATGAPTVLFGTPWDGRTMLEVAVQANRERDSARGARTLREFTPFHHEVSWSEVAATRPAYGAYVRAERERLGASHPLYLSQYELVASADAGRLLSAGQLALIEGTHARLRAPAAGERYVGGIDFAGEGETGDRTVLTIARVAGRCCEVVQHVAWRGEAYARLQDQVVALARQWRLERLAADATGLGGPLCARLVQELGARVEALPFTAALKSTLGFALMAAANTGALALYAPDGSDEALACRQELRECRSRLLVNGRVWWAAPPAGHDDYAVSLALCLRAAEGLGVERVARGRGMRDEA
ncbi:MAG: hypothetical protein ACR2HN_04110 [Tepidiformaceae bacterium]